MKKLSILFWGAVLFASCCCPKENEVAYGTRWSAEKANEWFNQTGWRSGCNYVPATAINQIEMWQEATYDPETIEKEFKWAEELGFGTMRVFLSSVVWIAEAESFKARIDDFLTIADKHGIKPVFVFFDDCWNPESQIGPQPAPKTGIHNSGWVQDPPKELRADATASFPVLKEYVQDILRTFGQDDRVLWWDLYNEPGNMDNLNSSFPLLRNVYAWAREIQPSQPLSTGLWNYHFREMNTFMLENADIISYHSYKDPADHMAHLEVLLSLGRPVYCTEYLARPFNSCFQNILPSLKAYNVGAINWGFVSGKTNTIYAWNDPHPEGEEPELWLCDILRQDKTPFSQEEVDFIKEINFSK